MMKLSQNITDPPDPAAALMRQRRGLFKQLERGPVDGFLKKHAALVDDYFLSSFAQSRVGPEMGIMRNPYALVALGGYGRAEQCVHSDIDLLFLFEKRVPPQAEALVREVVYPLWDMGLEVGHATRSVKECLQMAAKDHEVLTSLLDARFICGMSPLFHKMIDQLRVKLINIKPRKLIDWLVDSNRLRHQRYGDSAFLLEPNLKEGQGGLRDYHTMLWIARIQSDIKQSRDLEYMGYLSHAEYASLCDALAFVWGVRNRLHLLTRRKSDQLHLEHQTRLAEAMAIQATDGSLPVEQLMGQLHGAMEFIKLCYVVFLYELDQKKRLRRKNKALKETQVPGLKFNRGMLNFTGPEVILEDPRLLIKIFLESSVKKAPLNAEALRLVKEFGHLIRRPDFRSSPEVMADFEKILVRSGEVFNALSAMLSSGFLIRYIPQFGRVVNRIQFDQYHLYPVARHLLRTVRLLKGLGSGRSERDDPLFSQIYQEIKPKKTLLWAALLHDIGKAEPASGHAHRGAHMTREILQEKGMPMADIETVVFLVAEHLLLFDTASRRDINDEETALSVARKVGRADRLKMLYLLSVADAMATGPKAWNDWTASLLRSLFLKTLNVLEKGELVSKKAIRTIEEKKERILTTVADRDARSAREALLRMMSPRYLLYTSSKEIPEHIDLFAKLGDHKFVWQIEKSRDAETRRVTICAKDRPGLLARIAGVLTLNGINILDVRIFTWRNNIALDIFEVQAPPDPIFEEERWNRCAGDLEAALAERLDLSKALRDKENGFQSIRPLTAQRPQHVLVDNQSSSFFTIVEVTAWDFPGLLYRVSDALFRCHLDIWVAKIATRVDQVVDVFYVRNFDGEKADYPQEEAAIRETVEKVLRRRH
jgi:[protein-PII] uridylyltransferase